MIKTRIQRPVFLSIILLVLLASCTKKELRNGIPNFSWIEEVGAKRFPTQDHTPISVNDFGAVADTSIISTQAIQAAIDACAAQGGG
ncbi:MAG: glycoside hydrolase family 28 protein, partial [Bacteroidales bacterium]|nr:glycoside hydrolase family 28 protein [Bacteroidales bacterium]